MNKKVLLLYTSHTLGHKSIAENIGCYIEKLGYEVRLEDVLEMEKGPFVSLGETFHSMLNTYTPFVWKWMYTNQLFISLTLPWRIFLARFNSNRTERLVQDWKPDLIITTQTSASAVVSSLINRKKFLGKFAIAFSDYHFHPFWAYPDASAYLVNIEEQKMELEKLGVSAEKIFVCGMTLKSVQNYDPKKVKEKFNIEAAAKVVLLSSGSLGIQMPESLLDELLNLKSVDNSEKPVPVHMIFVLGRNSRLESSLKEKIGTRTNITVLGLYSPMDELYSVADIFISKPGGLSVAEALRAKIPLLITHALPGQEELNTKFLENKKLICVVSPKNLKNAISVITTELAFGKIKKSLEINTNLSLVVHNDFGKGSIEDAIRFLFHEKAQ